MAATINLAGRIPTVVRPLSGRLLVLGVVLFVVFIGAVVFGFRYRVKKQEARKDSQQIQTVAADSATSNRTQLEGGQSLPASTFSGSANGPVAPTENAPGTSPATPGYGATPIAPGQAGVQPIGASPATYSPFPAYQPMFYPQGPSIAQGNAPGDLRQQASNRQVDRRQQAIDAPTGVADQHAASATSVSSNPALDAAQGDIDHINSLLHQQAGSATPSSTPVVPIGATVLGENEGGQGYRGQNDQSGKRQFAEGGEGVGDDYLKTTRTPPLSPWVIQRGTVIPAALPNKLVSDLPGDLIAEVVRDVYDSPSQKYVEIPAGSRLVGEYNSGVSYAQNRVQVVWIAIYFPDGTFIDMDRMPSHSADGGSGLKDQVDNHFKRLVAGVALSSLLSAGLQLSQNRTNGSVLTYPSTGQVIASSVGSQASQLGEQLTSRNLNIQPTLKIRPGEVFAVSVKKDIIFPGPYEPMVLSK